ncbi:hypothetical protein [Desulfolucanica intricata]|uniref:hypothetical protein n=1 Tax=Desulfolucanica intricata TaxID=1285191 RepID=UPI00082A57F6|nr:hypothetical protein [Desulfolucanica intricata]
MYYITEILRVILDLQAHLPESTVIKHPTEKLWAIKISSEDHIPEEIKENCVDFLPQDWGKE